VNPAVSTIRQGDSVQVSVEMISANTLPAFADPDPITFSVSTTSAVQAVSGGSPISAVQAGANGSTFTFWLKALSAGGGTLTISHPDFVPFELTVSTRSP
jgi:hypothetical protein